MYAERTEEVGKYGSRERYGSGHNEAGLKTVCPKGRVGSNPTLSALYRQSWRNTQEAEGAPLERE